MMFRAPEIGTLYEGYAQKGFVVPILDGSPFPLGSTATSEPIENPRSLWGEDPSMAAGVKTFGSRSKAVQNRGILVTINVNRGVCGGDLGGYVDLMICLRDIFIVPESSIDV
jgi:hypothetical protein